MPPAAKIGRGTGIVAGCVLAAFALIFALGPFASAQAPLRIAKRSLITSSINNANRVRLFGNTRPEANAANDRGKVADNLPMEHLTLQLRRAPEQEQALAQFIERLHDPASPNYHRWLTPNQFGAQFGPITSDIQKITGWLQSQGFTVNVIYPSGMSIDFSGTAGQVSAAFHTEIHHIVARGEPHIANMSDPQIPAALAPAVVGIAAMHNIPHRPSIAHKREKSTAYSVGNGEYLLTAADLATIYNFNPAFNAGVSGQNQTIYLIEDTNLYSTNDWTTFRSVLGLSGYTSASLTTVHPAPPSGGNNCRDPGVNADDGEAILDTEWASAAAPSAAIVVASCANNPDGLLIAVTNLVNSASPPAIVSISYGDCEADNGAASNAAYNAIYQQGVAEGTSIFVSTGDQDAGVCDFNSSVVTHGISVNALASTPYNVAVGGTDFSDTYSGTASTYWNSGNTANYGSAKSYVPEIPWNGSCGSQLFANYFGYANTYGASGFCNNAPGSTTYHNNQGGSGGPSACATGNPSSNDVVSGTCQGYPKPSWQSGVVGIPSDGVRGLPDVSLFAANGWWNHYYVFCYSDPGHGRGGKSCTGAPNTWSGAGGTSFSSPIMAGVQALINQNMGVPQGNPNVVYYKLAANEYGAGGSAACNSSLGNGVGNSCIFYDVTLGDIDAPCTGTVNCYLPSGTNGVLSTSNSSYAPAYKTGTGWDFATGIGTVNVFNLVTGWKALYNGNPVALQVTPANNISASGNQGGPFSPNSFQYVVTAASGTVGYLISNVPSWLTVSSLSGTATTSGTAITFTVNSNPNGFAPATYTASIAFTDTTNNSIARTVTASLVVLNPASPNGVLQVSPASNIVTAGNTGGPFSPSSFNYQLSASKGSVGYSITGLPGWLTVSSDNGTVTTSPTTLTFTVNANANNFSAGSYSANVMFNDVTNGATIETIGATITVNNGAPGLGTPAVTYVSGNGNDTGVCPQIEPCATFAYALSVVSAGGEIKCLDPGDFGPVTIAKAISIACDLGNGGVLALSTDGIVVNAGASDVVNLKGLSLEGGGTGLNGINFLAGSELNLEALQIRNFLSSGIDFAPSGGVAKLHLLGGKITGNGNSTSTAGILLRPTGSASIKVDISLTQISNNSVGIRLDTTAPGGAINGILRVSTVAGNANEGVTAVAGTSAAILMLDEATVAGNNSGLVVSGSNASLLASKTTITGNGTGLLLNPNGTLSTYYDNSIYNNTIDGSFNQTVVLK